MKLTKELNEFNGQLAKDLLPYFPNGMEAYQDEFEELFFRGTIPGSSNPNHIGTHVAVELEQDVKDALDQASETDRKEMVRNLIANLGTQIKAKYDKDHVGQLALKVTRNMRILTGK